MDYSASPSWKADIKKYGMIKPSTKYSGGHPKMKNNSSIFKFLDLLKRDESEPDFKHASHPPSDSSLILPISEYFNETKFNTRNRLYFYRSKMEKQQIPIISIMIPEKED